MTHKPTVEDLIGLGHTKLGFFKEVQTKIGELKLSNRELERERKHTQAILDGLTDIVAVVSTDYHVRSVNHSYYDTFEQQNPTGAYCFEIFRNRNQPCEECVLREAAGLNTVCRKTAIISIGGKNHQFEITGSPLSGTEGEPSNIIVVKRDVTLEKEFQAKYYHAEKMATIGLLAAGVAHEINNPLTAIQGFTEGLRRRMELLAPYIEDAQLNEDFTEYLSIIRKECRRCSDIVQSLLTFSPRKQADFSRVSLNQLIQNVLRILQHRFKQHPGHSIELVLDKQLPEISGSAAELEQVILNLVLNALDAIPDTGQITIRTMSEPNGLRVKLAVEDNGSGIAVEHMPKLFEPFFTTKPVGKGTGIGLSTCYHILQAHGGEITVDSTPGEGSVFSVRLPTRPIADQENR